ncbi:MAG: hypothetical protein AVDCRST_MAG55-2129, partial [uncultured Rubrobacteraceae bacterium]
DAQPGRPRTSMGGCLRPPRRARPRSGCRLSPHALRGPGLRHRGGARHRRIRFRCPRRETRGDPVRTPEPSQRQGCGARGLPPGRPAAKRRRWHRWRHPQHPRLRDDPRGPRRRL